MNAYDEYDDEPLEVRPEDVVPESVALLPRVWTVFVAFLIAVGLILAVQFALVVAIVVWQLANGGNLQQLGVDLMDVLTDPPIFLALLLPTQIIIGAAGIVPAYLSREPTRSRLGMTPSALPIWAFPIVILGAGVPAAAGIALAYGLEQLIPGDTTFEEFFEKITWITAVPSVLFIALAPGFMEEIFFRGYMQRRLLARWAPWVAILVTSALFALVHMQPHHVLSVFPVGIWLGVIAWRADSIWPCIVCHAVFNACATTHGIGVRLLEWPEIPPLVPSVIAGGVLVVCFCVSIWLLNRCRPEASPAAPERTVAADQYEEDQHDRYLQGGPLVTDDTRFHDRSE